MPLFEAGRPAKAFLYSGVATSPLLSLNDLIATPSRSAANGFYVSNNDTAIKRNASISDTFDGLRRLAPAHSERVTPYSLLRAESGDGVDARAGHGDSGGFAAGSKAP